MAQNYIIPLYCKSFIFALCSSSAVCMLLHYGAGADGWRHHLWRPLGQNSQEAHIACRTEFEEIKHPSIENMLLQRLEFGFQFRPHKYLCSKYKCRLSSKRSWRSKLRRWSCHSKKRLNKKHGLHTANFDNKTQSCKKNSVTKDFQRRQKHFLKGTFGNRVTKCVKDWNLFSTQPVLTSI